jgi:hypothetical protein
MRLPLPLVVLICALAAPAAHASPALDPSPPMRSPDAKDAAAAHRGHQPPKPGPPAPKFPLALKKAISDHAPILYLHSKEQYVPTSAERFLAHANRNGDGLRLKDSNGSRSGDLGAARTYVHVKVGDRTSDIQYWFLYAYNGPGTAYFKYLKLYKYEGLPDATLGPCGRHEGDWEGVTVRVDNATGKIQQVHLNQHDTGKWVPSGSAVHGGRVVVYASHNGHATYEVAGRNYTETHKFGVIEFRLVNETNKGRAWDTRRNLQVISAHDLRGGARVASHSDVLQFFGAREPDWMKIKGRWGLVDHASKAKVRSALEDALGNRGAKIIDKLGGSSIIDKLLDKVGVSELCLEESGPTPPWSKPSWLGAES